MLEPCWLCPQPPHLLPTAAGLCPVLSDCWALTFHIPDLALFSHMSFSFVKWSPPSLLQSRPSLCPVWFLLLMLVSSACCIPWHGSMEAAACRASWAPCRAAQLDGLRCTAGSCTAELNASAGVLGRAEQCLGIKLAQISSL